VETSCLDFETEDGNVKRLEITQIMLHSLNTKDDTVLLAL
jgi:hypothetical protein